MGTTTRVALATISPVGQEAVSERLRRGIAEVGLDCSCRKAASDVLDRQGPNEHLARRASGLADARKMRDAIVIVLVLLGELDVLMPDEPNRSAFHEIAGLFQDIIDFAACGSAAALRAAGQGNA